MNQTRLRVCSRENPAFSVQSGQWAIDTCASFNCEHYHKARHLSALCST